MEYTDAQAWLNAHELVECKALKGRWTRKTCIEISRRVAKAPRNSKSVAAAKPDSARALPCANCPILAALENL